MANRLIGVFNGTRSRGVIARISKAPVLICAGIPGASGKDGASSSGGTLVFNSVAGQSISALRVVYQSNGRVYPLDYSDTDHVYAALGIALTAAIEGGNVSVQRNGAIEDNSWSWSEGESVYLGAGGVLTQFPPVFGFLVVIGYAISDQRILLDFQEPCFMG